METTIGYPHETKAPLLSTQEHVTLGRIKMSLSSTQSWAHHSYLMLMVMVKQGRPSGGLSGGAQTELSAFPNRCLAQELASDILKAIWGIWRVAQLCI